MKYEDTKVLRALDIPSKDELGNSSNPGSYVIYVPSRWMWTRGHIVTLHVNRWVHTGSTPRSKLKLPGTPLQKVQVDFLKSPVGTAEAIKLASNVLQNLNPEADRLPSLFLKQRRLWAWVDRVLAEDWGPDVDVPDTHTLYRH